MVCIGNFTIGISGESRRIDDEFRPHPADVVKQEFKTGVVQRLPRQKNKMFATASQFRRKRLTDESCGTENENHGKKKFEFVPEA